MSFQAVQRAEPKRKKIDAVYVERKVIMLEIVPRNLWKEIRLESEQLDRPKMHQF